MYDLFIAYYGNAEKGSQVAAHNIYNQIKDTKIANRNISIYFQPISDPHGTFGKTTTAITKSQLFLLVVDKDIPKDETGHIPEFDKDGLLKHLYEEVDTVQNCPNFRTALKNKAKVFVADDFALKDVEKLHPIFLANIAFMVRDDGIKKATEWIIDTIIEANTNSLEKYLVSTINNYNVVDISVQTKNDEKLTDVFVVPNTDIFIDIVVGDRKAKNILRTETKEDIANSAYLLNGINETLFDSSKKSNTAEKELPLLFAPAWKTGVHKKYKRLNALDAISLYRNSVVIGGAGTGKSSLLRFLAVMLASRYLGLTTESIPSMSEFYKKKNIFPVFISLKEFFSSAKGDLSLIQMLSYINKQFDGNFDSIATFKTLLAQNEIMFFLDGIDEIYSKGSTFESLRKFVSLINETFSNSIIVFSSRESAYCDEKIDSFAEIRLTSLDFATQKTLAIKLFQHKCENIEAVITKFFHELNNTCLDVEMTGTPFFLTLAVMIFLQKGSIPSYSSEIMAICVDQLIKRWQKKIGKDNADAREECERLKKCLERISYKALWEDYQINEFEKDPFLIRRDLLVGYLEEEFSDRNPSEMLSCFTNNIGIIVPAVSRVKAFKFIHRSFQEYLAARILKEKLIKMKTGELREELTELTKSILMQSAFFMAIEILLDEENFESLWLLVKKMWNNSSTDSVKVSWFVGKMLTMRNNKLFSTSQDEDYQHLSIVQMLNEIRCGLAKCMNNIAIDVKIRFDCGAILGNIGDNRHGVGLINKLPDISWCKIDGGEFSFGTTDNEIHTMKEQYSDAIFDREIPAQNVSVRTFYMSEYPITVQQFRAFIDDNGYENIEYWNWSDASMHCFNKWKQDAVDNVLSIVPKIDYMDNAPVVNISWIDAVAFCQWLSKKQSKKIRLPFEHEWEFAAKKHFNKFSFGEHFDKKKCVCREYLFPIARSVGVLVNKSIDWKLRDNQLINDETNEPADLNGNVWEWTMSIMSPKENLADFSKFDITHHNISTVNKDSMAIVKGGSFINHEFLVRNSYRGRDSIEVRVSHREGFRVIREE